MAPGEAVTAEIGDLPVEEMASAPDQAPWWRRVFTREHQGDAAVGTLAEDLHLEQAWEASPDGADRGPEESETPTQAPWWRRLATWLAAEEGADEEPPGEGAAAPLTLDDVRGLLQEESERLRVDTAGMVRYELDCAQEEIVGRVQDEVPGLVQAELAREQGDRYRAAHPALREVADEMAAANLQWLQAQQDLLNQQVLPALQDPELPVRERLALMRLVGDRPAQVAGYMAGLEAAASVRAVGADQALAGLDARGSVAELQAEVAGQSEVVAKLEAQGRSGVWGSWGLAPALLVLLLVTAIGVAGILLPRQSGPTPATLIGMAKAYQMAGDREEAVLLLDEAVETGVDDAETLGYVGELYRVLGQHGKAIGVLERAVEREPKKETYRLSLARSYGDDQQYREAIAQYQRLTQINPANPWYYAEMGHQYSELMDYDQALVQYEEMLEINPGLWQSYFYQAEMYHTAGRHDEAIVLYQEALEIEPDHYQSRLQLGASYKESGDSAAAIEQYRAAVEIDPEQAVAFQLLGDAYLDEGSYDRALEFYQEAIEQDDRDTASYVGLGKTYLELDDCANAVVQFAGALRRDPGSVEAKEGLAACAVER
jgi:tetratricopeptide (TPR) repeat protein